jgi:hypothetical protein
MAEVISNALCREPATGFDGFIRPIGGVMTEY